MSGNDYEPLEIETESSSATGKGISMILAPIADTMKGMEDDKRYRFELHIEEIERVGEGGDGDESISSIKNEEKYEEKMSEIHDGMLESYASGYLHAIDAYNIDAKLPTNPKNMMENRAISERFNAYWDGKSKPLKHWLRAELGLSSFADHAEPWRFDS